MLRDYAVFYDSYARINCAGTEGIPGTITEQTPERFAATFDTNVLGTLLGMKHELRAMLPAKRGAIVNVSSTYGHRRAGGAAAYAGASGVRVNAVAPGPTDTGMLDRFTGNADNKAGLVSSVAMKRLGAPDEVANAVLFLASEAAAFITGAVLDVDGGKAAR
jgi:NAD(P)-dependent dehydrogenase (short-subunit alcohol dehydrogenase family)